MRSTVRLTAGRPGAAPPQRRRPISLEQPRRSAPKEPRNPHPVPGGEARLAILRPPLRAFRRLGQEAVLSYSRSQPPTFVRPKSSYGSGNGRKIGRGDLLRKYRTGTRLEGKQASSGSRLDRRGRKLYLIRKRSLTGLVNGNTKVTD